jgi:LacI family transcriptional regulator
MVTLEEIAKLAHVSRSTVSRVINNEPNVSARTRERVQRIIRQVNFQPNWAARRLAGGRTSVLGLVVPVGVARLFIDPYFPLLIQGITSACNAHDRSVMLWLAEPEYERRMFSHIFRGGFIDGLIVSSMLMSDPLARNLLEGHVPFILVGRHPDLELQPDYVDIDNVNSARDAVAFLLRSGRRRVAVVAGPQNMIAGLDRLNGYLSALRERALTPDPNLIVDGDFTETGGYQAAQQLLAHKPDAIFACSDAMAIGALRALREARLHVPDDVAVVGFDDIPPAAHTDPPLTTVRQPIQQLGWIAVETLLDIIDSPSSSPRRILLPTELVIRSSSGGPRSTSLI